MGIFGNLFKKKQQAIIVNQEIDYEKLATAIVKAQKMIDNNQNLEHGKQKKRELENWHKTIGYKDYDDDNTNCFFKIVHQTRNFFSVLFHFIFFKRKNATSDTVTFGLLQMATSAIFAICHFSLSLLSLLLLAYSILTVEESRLIFEFKLPFLIYSFILFLFSRFFKIASFEMENLKDRNYMIAIFSAMTCFFSMLFALIALFKG